MQTDTLARTKQQRFDAATDSFTGRLRTAAGWRENYFGSVYSTRIRQAITEARDACAAMESALAEDERE